MAISLALTATLDLQSRYIALTSNPSSKAISLALAGSPYRSLLLVHLYLDMDVSHPCDFFLPLKELEGLIK